MFLQVVSHWYMPPRHMWLGRRMAHCQQPTMLMQKTGRIKMSQAGWKKNHSENTRKGMHVRLIYPSDQYKRGVDWLTTKWCGDDNYLSINVRLTKVLMYLTNSSLNLPYNIILDLTVVQPALSHQTQYIEPNVGLMLVQRHRRWDNIKPALVFQLFVFVGL